MTNGSLGISFAPTDEDKRAKIVGSPLQEAVQILKLHLPRFGGSRAPVPEALMGAGPVTPAGPGIGNGIVDSVLARLLGTGKGLGGAAPMGGAMQNPLAAANASQGGTMPAPSFNLPMPPMSSPAAPQGQPSFSFSRTERKSPSFNFASLPSLPGQGGDHPQSARLTQGLAQPTGYGPMVPPPAGPAPAEAQQRLAELFGQRG